MGTRARAHTHTHTHTLPCCTHPCPRYDIYCAILSKLSVQDRLHPSPQTVIVFPSELSPGVIAYHSLLLAQSWARVPPKGFTTVEGLCPSRGGGSGQPTKGTIVRRGRHARGRRDKAESPGENEPLWPDACSPSPQEISPTTLPAPWASACVGESAWRRCLRTWLVDAPRGSDTGTEPSQGEGAAASRVWGGRPRGAWAGHLRGGPAGRGGVGTWPKDGLATRPGPLQKRGGGGDAVPGTRVRLVQVCGQGGRVLGLGLRSRRQTRTGERQGRAGRVRDGPGLQGDFGG